MQVDTSNVNGETDPDPRSAILVPRNSRIDEDSFNKERLEKYLDTNVKNGDWLCVAKLGIAPIWLFCAGSIKGFQRSVDCSIVRGTLRNVWNNRERDIQLNDNCLVRRECKVEKTDRLAFVVGVAIAANALFLIECKS